MLDRDKLERLLFYVSWRAGQGARLDVITLNRVLWYADAQAFERTGQSITGARYVRRPDGPSADAITTARADLDRNGAVRAAAQAPDVSFLAEEEIAILDRWIERIIEQDGIATVEASLDYAWRIAEPGEEIPMAANLAGRLRRPSDDDLRWGRDIATKLALP